MSANSVVAGDEFLASGRRQEALLAYQQAVCSDPTDVTALSRMAELLTGQGNLLEAEACWGAVLEQQRDHADAHFALGQLRITLGKLQQARQHLECAARLRPGSAPIWGEFGRWAAVRGDVDQAAGLYLQAIASGATPHDQTTIYHLLATLGKRDVAVAGLREVAARFRATATGRRALAHTVATARRDATTAEIEEVEACLAAPLSNEDGARLGYALAGWHDSQRDFRRAEEVAATANEAMRSHNVDSGIVYCRNQHSKHVDQLLTVFDNEHFTRVRPWGNSDEQPVFVVGMPRSGTSLVEQILASHSLVFGAGELELARLSLSSVPYRVGSRELPEAVVPSVPEPVVGSCALDYRERIAEYSEHATRVVDKQPENYLYLGWISTLFPKARILLCEREPRDVATSTWLTRLVSVPWSCRLDDIRARIADQRRLVAHWRRVLPNPMLTVPYEALVNDRETWSRQLIDFIGLPWEDTCLHPERTQRWVNTASSAAVRTPVHRRSVNRWRNYATLFEAW